MWNDPTQDELEQLPNLYDAEDVEAMDKIIFMHLFIGGCDWYLAEYDPNERLFFGFAILNGDLDNAEWGYISLDELRQIKIGWLEIDRDLHWKPRRAEEVKQIAAASGWNAPVQSTPPKRVMDEHSLADAHCHES